MLHLFNRYYKKKYVLNRLLLLGWRAAGVHEKSELKKNPLGINSVSLNNQEGSSLIGFRGTFFFCFFSFGRAKEKKIIASTLSITL
jgi:hypothetical protein